MLVEPKKGKPTPNQSKTTNAAILSQNKAIHTIRAGIQNQNFEFLAPHAPCTNAHGGAQGIHKQKQLLVPRLLFNLIPTPAIFVILHYPKIILFKKVFSI